MITLQQVIKQRRDEFEEKFVKELISTQSDVRVKEWKLKPLSDGTNIVGIYYGPEDISSHNQETVIAILEAVKGEQEQFELFIDKILEGIDIADKKMGNTGGGTRAIRIMLASRVKPSQIIDSTLQDIKKQNNE